MTTSGKGRSRRRILIATVAVGLVATVMTLVALSGRNKESELAEIFAYEVDDSSTVLTLHFVDEMSATGCEADFVTGRVVYEGPDFVEVEVVITRTIESWEDESYHCDNFSGPPSGTTWTHLEEPLGDRSVVASGKMIHPYDHPCTAVPHMATVVEFASSGLTGEAEGPSLASQYTQRWWGLLEILPTDYAGPSSWTDLRPKEGCEAKSVLVVANDEQFADALVDPSLSWVYGIHYQTGAPIMGLATSGGLALCYRTDLFEAAGLPSTPEEVAAAMGDAWDGLVSFGARYTHSTGAAFLDDASSLFSLILVQTSGLESFHLPDGSVSIETARGAFDTVLAIEDAGIAAGTQPRSEEWWAGIADGTFAAIPCSLPMMDDIFEYGGGAESTAQWAVTDIPGPGGDLDRTWYLTPLLRAEDAPYRHEAAYSLLSWLRERDHQVRVAHETHSIPPDQELFNSPTGTRGAKKIFEMTSSLTGDVPVGGIFATSVLESADAPTILTLGYDIVEAIEGVLDAVEAGEIPASEAWAVAETAVKSMKE